MGIKQKLNSGTSFGLSLALLFFAYATSFDAGAHLVEAGKTTFKDVFRVFFAINTTTVVKSQSSTFAPDSSKVKSATGSIFAILDRRSNIDPSDESGTIGGKSNYDTSASSNMYPTRPNIKIFRDLSLTIHSGKIGMFGLKEGNDLIEEAKWLAMTSRYRGALPVKMGRWSRRRSG